MATAIILSGGTGTRFGANIPKQYLCVNDKPIFGYCLDTFQRMPCIGAIVVVASANWQDMIRKYVADHAITKFQSFAEAGRSRQHSILNGLRQVKPTDTGADERVIIHDAVRPCVSEAIIQKCVDVLADYDCSMPVISVKDTVYLSDNGRTISELLNRDRLYAGQAPEGCHLNSYLKINSELTDEELDAVRGTCAIAYEKGLSVGMFPGSEGNFKITTVEDYEKFKLEVEVEKTK